MGIIRPPWISREWFAQGPFNYCDHFGNKLLLATVCKICDDELKRDMLYKKAGKNPNDWNNVFKDVVESLAKVRKMLEKDAKRLGIDLSNLPDDYDEGPEPESYPIYRLIRKYGDRVEKIIKMFEAVPIDADEKLIKKALEALSHSRYYICAKIARTLNSRYEEQKDPEDDLFDSKTSAFFAFIAIERNLRALLALAKHKPLDSLREKLLRFAKISLEMADLIRLEFFPDNKLEYREFGGVEF
ncbi:hypothetical protein A3B40_04430 [Candidatus Roizmanbacteria bacterium RIFCSPLOWO2_01_FULL_37_16]|uniref:Uncharacterized protein n=1 Tax=Candidatus Roizmanbacteria bacterium RIFCSPLOWO2_01_FULL_37_16 TaxID=1802058 RepID=A0A1F7IJH1_9BACT|nr:MAG: hypothetical protein A2859_01365 [Candidatus Roizmanbacteria bacterium RIFCSPHIGHO2_01_FULL_37_16b]OGK43506.1 MAG: hypothetical protein A3B40_04430 [Candidatus Roizmanbacteria bacterium RIFCSPLOWO2_01_FULL_37_16]